MNSSCSHESLNCRLAAQRTKAAAEATLHDYRPELSTPALIAEVRQLLCSQRRAERLVCRYLADLADRVHQRCDGALVAFVDELHAAASFFALGARETRERVRIGRALRHLPLIEAAFTAGKLSYSRVRELTRVATTATEATWLEQTRHLDMRTLERHVASPSTPSTPRATSDPASGSAGATRAPSRAGTCGPSTAHAAAHPREDELSPEHPADGPAGEHTAAGEPFTPPDRATPKDFAPSAEHPACAPSMNAPRATARATPVTLPRATASGGSRTPARAITKRLARDAVRVTFDLSAEAWALLERALEAAREDDGASLSDTEALEAIAHHFLAAKGTNELAHEAADTNSSPAGEAAHCIRIHDPGAASARTRGRDAADTDSSPASEAAHCIHIQDPEAAGARRTHDRDAADTDWTPTNPPCGETTPHLGSSGGRESLLWIIERRSRWTLDELEHESGLSVPDLQYELLLLELGGRVRRTSGWIEPVRPPQARCKHRPLRMRRTERNPSDPACRTPSSPVHRNA